jgi:hypothetical protein
MAKQNLRMGILCEVSGRSCHEKIAEGRCLGQHHRRHGPIFAIGYSTCETKIFWWWTGCGGTDGNVACGGAQTTRGVYPNKKRYQEGDNP